MRLKEKRRTGSMPSSWTSAWKGKGKKKIVTRREKSHQVCARYSTDADAGMAKKEESAGPYFFQRPPKEEGEWVLIEMSLMDFTTEKGNNKKGQ